jgi:hypothetical protein
MGLTPTMQRGSELVLAPNECRRYLKSLVSMTTRQPPEAPFDLLFHADAGALSEAWATVEDSDHLDTFAPHVLHKPHKPFPIAMVNRRPHGSECFNFEFDVGVLTYTLFSAAVPGHHGLLQGLNFHFLEADKGLLSQTSGIRRMPLG